MLGSARSCHESAHAATSGDPLAVLDIGLTAGHRLDVLGVGQNQGEAVLQQVVEGVPVDAWRFHRDVGNPTSASQSPNNSMASVVVANERTVTRDLAVHTADDPPGDNEILVNIEPRCAGITHLRESFPRQPGTVSRVTKTVMEPFRELFTTL